MDHEPETRCSVDYFEDANTSNSVSKKKRVEREKRRRAQLLLSTESRTETNWRFNRSCTSSKVIPGFTCDRASNRSMACPPLLTPRCIFCSMVEIREGNDSRSWIESFIYATQLHKRFRPRSWQYRNRFFGTFPHLFCWELLVRCWQL